MKTKLFFSVLFACPFLLQAQTIGDSTAVKMPKPHHLFVKDSIEKEFQTKPVFVFDKDSIKPLDSVKHKHIFAKGDTTKPERFGFDKDFIKLQILDSAKHKHAFASKDSAKKGLFLGKHKDSTKVGNVEKDSLKHKHAFAPKDSADKKPFLRKHNDSTKVVIFEKDSIARKPFGRCKDSLKHRFHFFDSTLFAKAIDSAAADSVIAEKKSEKATASVYPNPSSGNISVETADVVTEIDVINLTTGKTALQVKNTSAFDVSELSAGVYLVKIKSGDSVITKTITKQ